MRVINAPRGTLARPAFRGDRRRVVADHRGKGIAVATLERGGEIRLDFVHHSDTAVTMPV